MIEHQKHMRLTNIDSWTPNILDNKVVRPQESLIHSPVWEPLLHVTTEYNSTSQNSSENSFSTE